MVKYFREYQLNREKESQEDKALLLSFIKGDKDAFTSIYNKYVDELFAYGISFGFERETVKDAIQDTFLKFYINRKQLKEIKHPKYFLFRILKNRLLDLYKSEIWKEDVMISDVSALPFLMEASALDKLILNEDKTLLEDKIKDLLATLTDRQKEAVYLRYIQEMEYDDIASLLEMEPSAVRKLISRAMKRMRQSFF